MRLNNRKGAYPRNFRMYLMGQREHAYKKMKQREPKGAKRIMRRCHARPPLMLATSPAQNILAHLTCSPPHQHTPCPKNIPAPTPAHLTTSHARQRHLHQLATSPLHMLAHHSCSLAHQLKIYQPTSHARHFTCSPPHQHTSPAPAHLTTSQARPPHQHLPTKGIYNSQLQ